jgi:hypothetical protein
MAAYTGLALYAALVYLFVVTLVPRVRPRVAAVVTLVLCCAVEVARLSPQTAELTARSAPARVVLGGVFNPADLACTSWASRRWSPRTRSPTARPPGRLLEARATH